MNTSPLTMFRSLLMGLGLWLSVAGAGAQLADVTQPGDPILLTAGSSPLNQTRGQGDR